MSREERDALVKRIMGRVSSAKEGTADTTYDPQSDVNRLVRERIERREREAQGDPLSEREEAIKRRTEELRGEIKI